MADDNILQLVNKQFVLNEDLMNYACFRRLWNRDPEDENRTEAYALIAFIFFFNNPKSPFYSYSEHERGYWIINEHFPPELLEAYPTLHEDADFVEANNIYLHDLNLSPYRAVIDACKQMLESYTRQMKDKNIPLSEKLDIIKKVNQGIEELKKAEKLTAEDEINSRVKGSRKIKKREA
jgi:hypothetical protein